MAYVKGAPEIILERSTHIFRDGQVEKLSAKEKKDILEANEKMANNALRVLGIAYKYLPSVALEKVDEENYENNLVFWD